LSVKAVREIQLFTYTCASFIKQHNLAKLRVSKHGKTFNDSWDSVWSYG